MKTAHLPIEIDPPATRLLPGRKPLYYTASGALYVGDSKDLLKAIPDNSVNLVFTSPPYPLVFKKEYGNVDAHEYVEWLMTFVREIKRVLTDDGSFVLNPFAGSNTTGWVAEGLGRKWVGFELDPDYAANSRLRFPEGATRDG